MKVKTDPVHIVECLSHSDHGGGQSIVYGMIAEWRSIYPDDKISIILPPKGIFIDRFKNQGVNVYEIPLDHLSLLTAIRMFILLRSLNPTVIHSHGKGAGLYTRIIPHLFLSAKRIHTYHGFHVPSVKIIAMIYRILESFLLRFTDLVISISKSEANEIQTTFRNQSFICKVIENVVDSKALEQYAKESLNPFVESFFKLHQDLFIVTMIARYDKVKNYPLALDSCSKVLAQNNDCAFLFVGIDCNDSRFVRLKKEYPDRICGVGIQSTTAAIIKHSNIIFLTSHKEGLPIVLQEAFCFSKPTVATNVVGINELIKNGINGTLCNENPDELAAGILRLVQDKSYYQQLCIGASKTAEKYDLNEWVIKCHEIYSN